MATIKELIDELRTVGEAYNSIPTVLYWDVKDIDSHRDEAYPRLLIERRFPIQAYDVDGNNITYRISFHFESQYLRNEEANDLAQDKQLNIETLIYQYFYELRKRINEQTPQKWNYPIFVSGNYNFNQHNDRNAEAIITMDFQLKGNCTQGTFTYK